MKIPFAFVLFSSLAAQSGSANISDYAAKYEALIGLKSVAVLAYVESGLARLAERTSLQTALEVKLRQNGIAVDGPPLFGPQLTLTVSGSDPGPGALVGYSVRLALVDSVPLPERTKTRKVMSVTVWSFSQGGIVPDTQLHRVRESAETVMNEFLNDWLKANPKK